MSLCLIGLIAVNDQAATTPVLKAAYKNASGKKTFVWTYAEWKEKCQKVLDSKDQYFLITKEPILMSKILVDDKFDPKISQKEENFLIYIYFPNLEEQIDFTKNGYELLLNGKTPISIEKLDRDDKKYEDMMLRNFWGSYYLVKFSNQELVQNLNITLKPKSSDATLNFEK